MAQKRSATEVFEEDISEIGFKNVKADEDKKVKKHTLDSDEEDDSGDDERYLLLFIDAIEWMWTNWLLPLTRRYNIMNENDIEGEEDGITKMDGEVKVS